MTWVRLLFFFMFCMSCCFCIEPVSTGVYFGVTAASASIYAATSFMYCVVSECCNQEKSAIIAKNWIKYDAEDKLRYDFKKKLHGQHLVESIVIKAITKHMKDSQPRKALVLSFHGWTGGGKNFVSYLIARNLYHEGLKSKFVHVISATEKFPDPTKSNEYKIQLMKFVKEQLSLCGRQLFIFDEIDKVPGGVIDALAPFLEYSVVSKEQNKAIFIFLSNTGGGEIARVTYSFYSNGMNREEIGLQDIESLIDLHAFNEEGGLKKSSLIHKNLIDFFIPFLPLEKIHVQSCIVDYLQEKYNITRDVNDKFVIKIANQLEYFPQDSKVYSKSGCKKVARKVDQAVD